MGAITFDANVGNCLETMHGITLCWSEGNITTRICHWLANTEIRAMGAINYFTCPDRIIVGAVLELFIFGRSNAV